MWWYTFLNAGETNEFKEVKCLSKALRGKTLGFLNDSTAFATIREPHIFLNSGPKVQIIFIFV